jgi:anaerobic magnesium-protoporphyrin IX monomethyl ester cyclase
MKVLFLNPPFFDNFSRESRSPAVAKSGTLYMPKWLCTAAGVAIKEGYDVDVIDAPAPSCPVKNLFDYIGENKFEAVVCDSSTPSIINDIGVVEKIIKLYPSIKVIMVGRHVSAMPKETFELSTALEFLAVREYEYIVRDWLHAIKNKTPFENVKGLAWRDDTKNVVINPSMPPIKNLDEIPFVTKVYKEFLTISDYYYGHSLHPLVVFDTSRGCPFKCTFCAYPQTFSGHKMRYRSIENVADEFDYVARNFPGIKTIMLEDDTFIINVKRTEKLADELIKRGNKIPFDSNCRYDTKADLKFFEKLHKAGARLFCVGFESGNDEVLQKMLKGPKVKVEQSRPFVDKVQKAGIMVHGCFMLGNLNETKETMQSTLDMALDIRPDTAQFYPIMVYPGTAAYEEAKHRGMLETEDFTKWLTSDGLHNSVVSLPNISHKELVEFADHARNKFYTSPKYIAWKVWQSLKSYDEFHRNFKGFRVLVKYLIQGSFGRK